MIQPYMAISYLLLFFVTSENRKDNVGSPVDCTEMLSETALNDNPLFTFDLSFVE